MAQNWTCSVRGCGITQAHLHRDRGDGVEFLRIATMDPAPPSQVLELWLHEEDSYLLATEGRLAGR